MLQVNSTYWLGKMVLIAGGLISGYTKLIYFTAMLFFKYLFIAFSSVLLCGAATAHSLSKRIDSIYNHMTPEERLSQLVWIQVSGQNKTPLSILPFGGIYYDQPLTHVPEPLDAAVAVQLDTRINPMPHEMTGLPDLYTLATITQSDLLSTYFYFLKSSSRALGIDYLILPPPDASSSRQRSLLDKMVAFDPVFFKKTGSLAFEQTRRKKDLQRIFDSKDFWVIDSQYADKARKGLHRHSEKIGVNHLEYKIKETLITNATVYETERKPLPNQLAVALSRASIIPLQRQAGILPLSVDTVSFITNHPYGAKANMLRKYAYVITSFSDLQKSNSPVIIDNDAVVPAGIPMQGRKVIFIGSLENSRRWLADIDAALIYTLHSDIYTYVIPQQLFGATEISGALPIHGGGFAAFLNDPVAGKNILGYAPPEMTGLDVLARERISSIVNEAILSGSTPGCQLAVAVDGAIVLDEAYGYLTYDSLVPVGNRTLFDVASVTKVAATLLAVMKLYEDGQLDLDQTLGHYLPTYQNSNKKDITIRAVLSHNAGLRPYVPFWQKTLSGDRMQVFYYENELDQQADNRSYGYRPTPVLMDSLKNWILQSSLLKYDSVPPYSYSDIGFMILHQVVEEITQLPLDEYLEQEFYQAMGLDRVVFNPRNKGFDLFEIAPTEYDYYFRDELVWGEVHDRNAAVFGGVAGHAGLFSNAQSLVVILQALLQGGQYGGKQFLSPHTIDYFNQRYFANNRRALGWDKKDDAIGHVSGHSSDLSFGHTGFTGTVVWVDPSYDLIFVFLSNRIYPDSNNVKLIQKNIRTRIQDVVYEAILAKWMNK